jgi:hypothetical protein
VAAATGPAAPFVFAGAAIASAVGSLFSFGKDPYKQAYDDAREEIGQRFQAAHDNHQQTGLAAAVATIDRLCAELEALYNQLRPNIEASWIDPRFRDQYDFMRQVADDWRRLLAPTAVPTTYQTGAPRLVMPGNAISTSANPTGLFQNTTAGQPAAYYQQQTGGASDAFMWIGLAALAYAIARG